MLRSIYFSTPDSTPQRDLSLDSMRQALKNPEGLLWVSLECAPNEETLTILDSVFHFHPLAIEDSLSAGFQTPKVDDFNTYIFIIAYGLPLDGAHDFDNAQELNLFLGANFLVTITHSEGLPAITKVWNRIFRDDRLITNGADFLCHAILDHLIDDYFPLLDRLDEEIETLEDDVLANPRPAVLARVLTLKHEIIFLRRIISPQRENINRLSRDDFPMIDRQSRIYFRDIYDHLVRIQDLCESLRDVISGVQDIYLNSTSLRMNEIMKALTVVSTIFLPLTFIAGVYGMNFHFMPELSWELGYLFVWIVFVTIFVGMLAFFKKKNWF
jgi:magnesium transporter